MKQSVHRRKPANLPRHSPYIRTHSVPFVCDFASDETVVNYRSVAETAIAALSHQTAYIASRLLRSDINTNVFQSQISYSALLTQICE